MENQRADDAGMAFWRRNIQHVLFVAAAVDFTIFFAVVIGLIPLTPNGTPICTSPACVQEARRITHQVNSQVNPCEDLYEFVCGNCQRYCDSTTALEKEVKKQIILLYMEPIKTDDHPMVATMKKLYQACLNEASSQTSTLNIEEIKKTLKMAGGWPLLEGSKWDERKFSWLQATYKFRELGYYYKMFINLSITVDPRNRSKHIFEVSLPNMDVVRKTFMKEIAVLFGANETDASSAVDEMDDYLVQLFYEIRKSPWNNDVSRVLSSITTYQQKQRSTINWLEFINRIIDPAARISHKDLVLFPDPEKITMWLNLLSKIPKRIQANYMMWKAIEDILSDIKLHGSDMQFLYFEDYSTHECLKKMQKRFRHFPNPIDVLYIKKYLPVNKLQKVEDLVRNVKVTFLELLEKVSWLNMKDRKSVIKTMHDRTNNKAIIGAPKIYFQDKILDEMAVDLKYAENDNYLKLLLKLNKNYQSLVFKQIFSSVDETKFLFWNLAKATEESLHYYAENAIALPATILQGFFFNENRPNYLNYGSLGSFIAAEYANQLTHVMLAKQETTNTTENGFLKIRRCFLQQVMKNLKFNGVMAEWDFEMLHQSLSTHISYSAYQKSETSNGVEPKLASTTYSNYQLFWISAASFYCHHLYSFPKIFNINKQYSFYVSGIGLNNANFAKDFKCPLKSKMNPLEKCYVF